ncbi:glycosyltransferase family 2 protein [Flavobacterium aquiphilum]|uniref:glycosyltransferase family 2 protein n=1 Tax=Flavobacterium aquiphilum TaxID=3003261 RepID=UPI002481074C|nr:glycosyltransferase family 2 protein [Flavobacterium aquiphilum]
MPDKLISIIIPVYNRALLIGETLNSVLEQSYSNWECLIIDDGSKDNTNEVVKTYVEKDKRFHYYKRPDTYNIGGNGARNYGLEVSKGLFVQFLDSDDLLAKNKLESQMTVLLKQQSDYYLISCKWEYFKDKNTVIQFNKKEDYKIFESPKNYFDLIGKIGGFFPPHCFLIPKKLIEKSGFWNEDLLKSQDAEFFFRVISNSRKILFDENTYVLYRQSLHQNVSMLNSLNKAKSLINCWKIIEALYIAKFPDDEENLYVNKKKNDVYNEIKKRFPELLKLNKDFFKTQIQKDNFAKKMKGLYKRIKLQLKNINKSLSVILTKR